MPEIKVLLGDEIFQFDNFDNWCDTAKYKFKNAGYAGTDTVCLDTKNRVCACGAEFMRAQSEDTFPIRVFIKLCG